MTSIPRLCGVYSITCQPNGKVYIGSSANIHKRWTAHRNSLNQGNHANLHLQRAWNKHGAGVFMFAVLEEVPEADLLAREAHWIAFYRATNDRKGFNISLHPGAPMKGRRHNAQTLQGFSSSRMGEQNANYRGPRICKGCGKPFARKNGARDVYCSQECYHGNRVITDEMRKRWRETSTGRKRTVDALAKQFEARAGWYVLTDPGGNEHTIKGLAAFCRERGLDQGSMSAVISGRRKTCKGWTARRLD